MKKLICVISFFVFCLMGGSLMASPTYRLLVYGDSLSAGYGVGTENSFGTLLQKELKKKGYKNILVVNKSKSGETTAGGLVRLEKILKSVKPNGIILELGINDVFRGNSVQSIEMNLERMIKMCQSRGIDVLLAGMKAPPYAGEFYQKEFNKMYQTLATKYHLILYPFFMKGLVSLEDGVPVSKYTLNDKVHPNVKGISLIVNNMMPFVEKFLKNQN